MDTATIEKKLASLKAELACAQGTPTEVYSRIVGYYRSVKNWNAGKRDEFSQRATFRMPSGVPSAMRESVSEPLKTRTAPSSEASSLTTDSRPVSYILFTRMTCPNCPAVKEYLGRTEMKGEEYDVDTPEGLDLARGLGILASPTAILLDGENREIYRAFTVTELRAFLEPVAAIG